MLSKFQKGILALTASASLGLYVADVTGLVQVFEPSQVLAEETTTNFVSQGGSEFEAGTFSMTLQVGDSGQILRPQDSVLKDFRYSFAMQVEDPSILTFDEEGNWQALKAGTTRVIPNFPSGDTSQAQKFQEELAKYGVSLTVNEIGVSWQVTVTEATNSQPLPMYRLYNPNNREHFYTSDLNEKDALVAMGWGSYEGIAWQAPSQGQAVYRLYNPILKDHHYTSDLNEVKVLASQYNWNEEGLAWYSAGATPVYRLFNKNLQSGSHHYTKDINEVKVLQTRGWVYEGIAWYGED